MAFLNTFIPAFKSGKSIVAGAASASAALGTETGSLCLTNTGTEIVYVAVGDSTIAAAATDYPVLGGTQVSIGRDARATHVAAICPTGAATLLVISGEGM